MPVLPGAREVAPMRSETGPPRGDAGQEREHRRRRTAAVIAEDPKRLRLRRTARSSGRSRPERSEGDLSGAQVDLELHALPLGMHRLLQSGLRR